MPRRNLFAIMLTLLVSVACADQVERGRYGRHLAYVFNAIDRRSLDRVPSEQLFDGAMEGIVGELDEYSSYVPASDVPDFEDELDQEIGGIGVLIRMEDAEAENRAEGTSKREPGSARKLIVANPPIFGTPAFRAGIRVRDQIVSIGGLPTAPMTMRDVIREMRGPVGEPVRLSVLHEGEDTPVEMTIVRALIKVPSVKGNVPLADGGWDYRLEEDPRIGLIRLESYGEQTVAELTEALQAATGEGAEAIVLDLRDNPGGLLQAAVGTCDLFLPADEQIVSIRGRDKRVEREYTSSGDGPYVDLPLAVLVNKFSASASEIVAACLQDHRRAAVVGVRTWGKGNVQHVIQIEAGRSRLKLTAASYSRPSGRNIHRHKGAGDDDPWGVRPDPELEVALSVEEERRRREARARRDLVDGPPALQGTDAAPAEPFDDLQLRRAVERLQGQLSGRSDAQVAGS